MGEATRLWLLNRLDLADTNARALVKQAQANLDEGLPGLQEKALREMLVLAQRNLSLVREIREIAEKVQG